MLYCMYDEIYAMFTFTVMLAYVCMPKIVFSRQNEISNDEIQTMLVYQYIYNHDHITMVVYDWLHMYKYSYNKQNNKHRM